MSDESASGRNEVVDILCVERDSASASALGETLSGDGRVVHGAVGAEEALAVLESDSDADADAESESESIDCIVSEYRLPGADGVTLARSVRDSHPEVPFVIYTDYGDYEAARAAIEAGVSVFLEKSDGPETLRRRIEEYTEASPDRQPRAPEKARLDALTSVPSTVVVSIDADSTIDYVNGNVRSVFGYEPSELVGEKLTTLMPERFRESHEEGLQRFVETGNRSLDWSWIELPGLHADGTEIPLGITFGVSVVDGKRYFTGVLRDITEQKQKQKRREANLEALRNLNEISSNADSSLETKAQQVLELGCELLDVPFGFVTNIDVEADRQRIIYSRADHPGLQPGKACPLSEAYCRKTLETDRLLAIQNAPEEGWSDDIAYERFDLGCYIGAKLYVDDEVYGTLCFAANDPRADSFSGFERTFVELMAEWLGHELERHQRAVNLQRQNERLDEFVSIVSHDLRNPLSVLKGSLELLEEERNPEDIERARDAAERMDTLIDDMLVLARQGEDLGELEPISLSDVLEDAWGVVSTPGARLVVETSAEVWSDESRLQQLFENLLRNAIEHGGEDVTVTVGDLEDGAGFYLADDGVGIPQSEREKVLKPGYSGGGGTGYGLGIVARIAEVHGWDLSVTESADGGARFEFESVGRA